MELLIIGAALVLWTRYKAARQGSVADFARLDLATKPGILPGGALPLEAPPPEGPAPYIAGLGLPTGIAPLGADVPAPSSPAPSPVYGSNSPTPTTTGGTTASAPSGGTSTPTNAPRLLLQ